MSILSKEKGIYDFHSRHTFDFDTPVEKWDSLGKWDSILWSKQEIPTTFDRIEQIEST